MLLLTLAFGVIVEIRSVHLSSRKTDIGCYLRAAWAVRTDTQMYEVVDDNGWHYAYPPLLGILFIPFADAPAGQPQLEYAVPYRVSVAIWYLVSMACVFLSIHMLAKALEETGNFGEYAERSERWWWMRFWPFAICIPAIGSSLSRGQVNTVILLTIAGFAAETIRNRRGYAGLWLAAGICLKVIPGFLLIVPLFRRDTRTLAACAAGLVIGLGIIPSMTMGPERAFESSRIFLSQTILPGLGQGGNGNLSRELTSMTATDNQSFLGIIHNLRHWSETPRPAAAEGSSKLIHVILTLLFAGTTLILARRRQNDGLATLLLIGNMTMIMVLASPINHHHYFCLAIPLWLGIVAVEMQRTNSTGFGRGMIALIAIQTIASILPKLPGLEKLRDAGVTMQGGAMLCIWGAVTLRQLGRSEKPIVEDSNIEVPVRRAA